MFRKMRRENQSISAAECTEILKTAPRGVLAVHGEDGYPYAVPMDFLYANGKLYFHCAKAGHKLDAVRADSRVSFCVTDTPKRCDGEWFYRIKSVIVFGEMTVLQDGQEKLKILYQLGAKYCPYPAEIEKEVNTYFEKAEILQLAPAHISGKAIQEK